MPFSTLGALARGVAATSLVSALALAGCGAPPIAATPVAPVSHSPATAPAASAASLPAFDVQACQATSASPVRLEAPRQQLQAVDGQIAWKAGVAANGLFAVTSERGASLWDAGARALVRHLPSRVSTSAPAVAFGDGGSLVALASMKEGVRVFETSTGKLLRSNKRPTGQVLALPPGSAARWITEDLRADDELNGIPKGQLLLLGENLDIKGALLGQLEIETCSSIAISASGNAVVCASDLPTQPIYLWRLKEGRPDGAKVSIAPPDPVGAIALSPDGRRALVGIRALTPHARSRVFLLDLDAPAWDKPLLDTSDISDASTLGFSPDGTRIATGLGEWGYAWDTATRKRSFAARFATTSVFTPDGQLIAEAPLGPLMVYSAGDFRSLGTMGSRVQEMSSPQLRGDLLVTSEEVRPIGSHSVWSWRTGALVERAAGAIRWTAASETLLPNGDILSYDADTHDKKCPAAAIIYAAPKNASTPPDIAHPRRICIASDEAVITGAPDAQVLLISKCGKADAKDNRVCKLAMLDLVGEKRRRELAGTVRSSGHYGPKLWMSPDGRWVIHEDGTLWDAASGKRAGRVARPKPSPYGDLVDLRFSRDGTRVAWWWSDGGTSRVSVADLPSGKILRTVDPESITGGIAFIGPDDLVLGEMNGAIELWHEGTRVAAARTTGDVREVLVPPGGDAVLTITSHERLDVWDAHTLALRGTVVDFTDGEWTSFTPGGAYDGTAEVGRRVAWVYDSPLDPFSFEQFAAQYQNPKLVRDRFSGKGADAAPLRARPPLIKVEALPRTIPGDAVTITAHVQGTAPIDAVRVYAEGRLVAAKSVCSASGQVDLPIRLLPGTNRISAIAFDAAGYGSNPATFDIVSNAPATHRPDLWIAAIGIDHYPRLPAEYQLSRAAADARGIAEAFSAQSGDGKPYAATHIALLRDEEATVPAIEHALSGLAGMRPDDVAIVFLAGHGIKLGADQDMVFITGGAALERTSIASNAIGWTRIGDLLAAAKGRVVMLLDACHSGHLTQELVVPNNAMADGLVRSGRAGVIVFAAAKGRQLSYEPSGSRGLVLDATAAPMVTSKSAGDHGFFTGALLAGLIDPATDRNQDGAVQLSELIDVVSERVSTATQDAQTPWVARRELFGDFTIARSTEAH